jgi:hypothetical protein
VNLRRLIRRKKLNRTFHPDPIHHKKRVYPDFPKL